MENGLVKISDAARMLGVTTKTLRLWEKSGAIKAVRTVGKHRRFKLDDIQRLLEGTNGGN